MNKLKRFAIYPGSFDPITNGHVDVIRRAADMFDQVIVGVLEHHAKDSLFTVEERVSLIKESVADIPHVSIESFDGLLIDFAKRKNARTIVRGLRMISDFDYEFQMAITNRQLLVDVETVFLMTDEKYSFLSSSLVRQIAKFHGTITTLVPPAVSVALDKKFSR